MQQGSSRENPAIRGLEERSPAQWIEQIEKMVASRPVRAGVAKLVWWDFYSGRKCTERVSEFDKYLRLFDTRSDDQELAKGLEAVGYPPQIAVARVKGKGGGIHAKKVAD